jgi:hypothetical protein
MEKMALTDDSEYESAKSERKSTGAGHTKAVSAIRHSADSQEGHGSPSVARVDQHNPKNDASTPVCKSKEVFESSLRVRCPDETTEIISLPEPSRSERTVKDLQQVLEIRKGYPLHSSKLCFEEVPGGILTELKSKTILQNTAIRNGDTLYCTINLDVG